jgi:small subunit ribosomal protein S19
MVRSLKKGFYVNPKIEKKVQDMNSSWDKKVIKTWDRACQIIPDMIWFTFAVHNGKQFVSVYVTEDMMWHRLGEFVPTRTFRGHPF